MAATGLSKLTTTLLQQAHSYIRPPQPSCRCSHSSLLLVTRTLLQKSQFNFSSISFPRPYSHYDIIRGTVRGRSFSNGGINGENDDDDDGVEFVRRKRSGWWKNYNDKKKKRRWWSDEVKGGFIDEAVDNLWILQVFRSYGLFLPVILLSLLLATGPKAFLIGSGIPFGLSTLVFAFQKLSESLFGSRRTTRRHRRRTKSQSHGKEGAFKEAEDELGRGRQQGSRNAYKTTAHQHDSRVYDRHDRHGANMTSFGGWDELIGEDQTQSTERSPQTKGRVEMMSEKVKMHSSKVKEKGTPLLLRLFVAVFPFLGSWTNLL